jgi:hypothetical protein
MRQAAMSGFFRMDEHSGLTPQSLFSPDFFRVVSECVARQYLDFSAGTWNVDPDPHGSALI